MTIELATPQIVQLTAHCRLHMRAIQKAAMDGALEVPALRDFLRWFGMSTAEADNFLKLFFQNVAWPNVGDVSGLQPSGTAGSIYVSLHTADPGVTGDQTTSESAYSSYARQAVARSSSGWDESSAVASNHAAITFPQCGVTGSTVTYVAIGSAVSGAGHRYASGALTSPSSLIINNGITPSFAIGALTITAS